MTRRVPTVALLAALVFSGLLSPAASADTGLPVPLPSTMAAVGDSISQAASTGGSLGTDYPQNSWSTGTSGTVNSHYLRLLALGAPISGQNNNRSVSGAKAAGLNAQMQTVVGLQPDYLTVQIGGNDLCTDTFAQMTSVTDFRAQFQTAMATIAAGSPNTNIYVVSIPDAYQLWSLFKSSGWARFIWSLGGVCQSLLANPTSTQAADVQRRADVRQRNIDYNTQLREVCAAFAKCRFDGNAVFNTQFAKSDIAGDYFHPSIAGQAKLAAVSWAVGYAWATSPQLNVAPTASFTSGCTGLTCTFTDTSTDSDGTITSRSWMFGDGSAVSTDANLSHTFPGAGTYTVGLIATDDDGATASTSQSVTVSSPPTAQQMWVGSLLATTAPAGRSGWAATVTIQIAPPAGAAAGVTVTGTWSAGSGATTCTTDEAGKCSLKSSTLNKKTASVTFAVTNMTRSGWTYDSAQNVVTSILVNKP